MGEVTVRLQEPMAPSHLLLPPQSGTQPARITAAQGHGYYRRQRQSLSNRMNKLLVSMNGKALWRASTTAPAHTR
jgi:hypothetical protein